MTNINFEPEFVTSEDYLTVLAYKRQMENERGYQGVICIDINRLSEIYERKCKMLVEIFLMQLSLDGKFQ